MAAERAKRGRAATEATTATEAAAAALPLARYAALRRLNAEGCAAPPLMFKVQSARADPTKFSHQPDPTRSTATPLLPREK